MLHGCVLASSLQSCPTLCDPTECMWPTRLLRPWGSPAKNTGVGCHLLCQGELPNPGIEPLSLMSPALADGFFTTSTTWEDPCNMNNTASCQKSVFITQLFTEADRRPSSLPWARFVCRQVQPAPLSETDRHQPTAGCWLSPARTTAARRSRGRRTSLPSPGPEDRARGSTPDGLGRARPAWPGPPPARLLLRGCVTPGLIPPPVKCGRTGLPAKRNVNAPSCASRSSRG